MHTYIYIDERAWDPSGTSCALDREAMEIEGQESDAFPAAHLSYNTYIHTHTRARQCNDNVLR